jgi:hypothetical protein
VHGISDVCPVCLEHTYVDDLCVELRRHALGVGVADEQAMQCTQRYRRHVHISERHGPEDGLARRLEAVLREGAQQVLQETEDVLSGRRISCKHMKSSSRESVLEIAVRPLALDR